MTASKESVRALLEPVVNWLAHGGDTWQMDVNHWSTRRELMNAGEMFDGPPSELLSNIDTAMDGYNPDPDPELQQIDEAQLRKEIEQAIAGLKRLGYLTGA